MNSEMKLLIAIIVAMGAGGYGYYLYSSATTGTIKEPTEAVKPQQFAETTDTQAQFPVPKNFRKSSDNEEDGSPFTLPQLEQSDESIASALAEITDRTLIEQLFNSHDFIRSVVVTVDNLTKSNVPPQFLPVKPPTGEFLTDKKELEISDQNYLRYEPYVSFAEKINLNRLGRIYVRYYPLFQRVYLESAGSGYFNDRLVQVVDSLLKTPDILETIRVKKAIVSFKYSDQKIESLNAGQKIMIRMGTKNSTRMKEVLRKLRGKLVNLADEL